MSRVRPDNRFDDLIRCGIEVFIESRGYKRTLMEDIAKRMNVSKATLYLYVESKAALFDLLVRQADSPSRFNVPSELPIPTPPGGSTLAYVQNRLATDETFKKMALLLLEEETADPRAELETIIRMLYGALSGNRRVLKLVETASLDHPELRELWFSGARGGIMSVLAPYIERRVAQGHFGRVPDSTLAARYVLENCMVWAIHIHWDPHPEPIDHRVAEETVIHFVLRTLLKHEQE